MAARTMDDGAAEWRFARGLTVDLLRAARPGDLLTAPISAAGPLWKQFRHIGRVHGDYLNAVESGAIAFDPASGDYEDGASQNALIAYFDRLNRRHDQVFTAADPDAAINWFGEDVPLSQHLTRLIAHEALHHGQLMLYWRALNRPFPESWASLGEV